MENKFCPFRQILLSIMGLGSFIQKDMSTFDAFELFKREFEGKNQCGGAQCAMWRTHTTHNLTTGYCGLAGKEE